MVKGSSKAEKAKSRKTDKSGNSNGESNDWKRIKTDVLIEDVVSPTIWKHSDDKKWAKEYASNMPYPHGILPNVFCPDFLQRVIKEIKDASTVNFKESDLFRMYQTMDLANLSQKEHSDTLPTVLQLRNLLYSDPWRRFMERISGLPPNTLSSTQVDCACNCHTAGCHLLCHDDVIGTRRLSYIIYLTEPPDQEWTANEGGALELYDRVPRHTKAGEESDSKTQQYVPDTIPSKTILPLFNHLAYFAVEPGRSFHAIQEVMNDQRPRLSLQGWYHAKDPPPNVQWATRSLLKESSLMTMAAADDDNEEEEEEEEEEHNDDKKQNRNGKKKEEMDIPENEDDENGGPWQDVPYAATEASSDKSENACGQKLTNTAAAASAASKEDSSEHEAAIVLTKDDVQYLSKYLHETYLSKTAWHDMAEQFESESSIQLRGFLNAEWMQRIQKALAKADEIAATSDDKAETATMQALEKPPDYKAFVQDPWKLVGPAHKQRFLEFQPPPNKDSAAPTGSSSNSSSNNHDDEIGWLLFELRQKLLLSPHFGRWLQTITGLSGVPERYRGKIRRFRRGLDYTVAHYGLLTTRSILDATLCFVQGSTGHDHDESEGKKPGSQSKVGVEKKEGEDAEDDDEDAPPRNEVDMLWECGDVGGFECYIAADDEDEELDDDGDNDEDDGDKDQDEKKGATTKKPRKKEAPDEYNNNDEDDDTELLSVCASNNTLNLVYRDLGTLRFVKYVGCQAPSSRFDIAMEYQMPEPDVHYDDLEDDDEKAECGKGGGTCGGCCG